MDINIMMDPSKLVFESDNDVIDYVTKGLIPPRKKNFDLVMSALKSYSENPIIEEGGAMYSYSISDDGKDISIKMKNIAHPDSLKECMERVQKNRTNNMKKVLIGAGVISILIIGGHVKMIKKRDDEISHSCHDQHMLIGGEMSEIDIPPCIN